MTNLLQAVITVTNSNDPTCQRLKLTERHEIVADGNSSNDLTDKIVDIERRFREIFPRGMTYSVPYTTVDIEPVRQTDAMRLLREAYASGQLRGTVIGDKLRDYFGVSYTHPSIDTAPDTPLLSQSLGGHA